MRSIPRIILLLPFFACLGAWAGWRERVVRCLGGEVSEDARSPLVLAVAQVSEAIDNGYGPFVEPGKILEVSAAGAGGIARGFNRVKLVRETGSLGGQPVRYYRAYVEVDPGREEEVFGDLMDGLAWGRYQDSVEWARLRGRPTPAFNNASIQLGRSGPEMYAFGSEVHGRLLGPAEGAGIEDFRKQLRHGKAILMVYFHVGRGERENASALLRGLAAQGKLHEEPYGPHP